MKCSSCGKEKQLRTAVRSGKLIENVCDSCLASFKGFADYSRKFERDSQRRTFAKDIIQRWDGDKPNPEFIKNYPQQSVKQWGQGVLRDHGIKRRQF